MVVAQSIEARCLVENEDVVGAAPTGDAPTTSELSTILLPTKVRLNLEVLRYDQQAFSPLDLTANWLSNLALLKYMFVVVNFDALAQASDIGMERRQVVFLCWMQDSKPRSQSSIRQLTECLLANWLSYRGSSKKNRTGQSVPMISKHSTHSTSLPIGFRIWL